MIVEDIISIIVIAFPALLLLFAVITNVVAERNERECKAHCEDIERLAQKLESSESEIISKNSVDPQESEDMKWTSNN